MAERRPAGYPKLKNYKPSKFMLPTSHYDKAKADRAVKFIENLCHTKGKWAGKRFWLLPWQEQLIRDIFGIVKPDGNRQFRTAFVEICKKVGKSELAAAVVLYLLYADNEPSAEVYGAADDRQQASIVFDVARQMVEMSPALLKRSKLITDMIISSEYDLITLNPDRQLCSGTKELQDKNDPANSRLKVTRIRRAVIQKGA